MELVEDLGAKLNKCFKINEYRTFLQYRSRSFFDLYSMSVIVGQFQTISFI